MGREVDGMTITFLRPSSATHPFKRSISRQTKSSCAGAVNQYQRVSPQAVDRRELRNIDASDLSRRKEFLAGQRPRYRRHPRRAPRQFLDHDPQHEPWPEGCRLAHSAAQVLSCLGPTKRRPGPEGTARRVRRHQLGRSQKSFEVRVPGNPRTYTWSLAAPSPRLKCPQVRLGSLRTTISHRSPSRR